MTKAERDAVIKAGGLLIESYLAAEVRAEQENYQLGNLGLIPRVAGTFARAKIDGLRIYVPARSQ